MNDDVRIILDEIQYGGLSHKDEDTTLYFNGTKDITDEFFPKEIRYSRGCVIEFTIKDYKARTCEVTISPVKMENGVYVKYGSKIFDITDELFTALFQEYIKVSNQPLSYAAEIIKQCVTKRILKLKATIDGTVEVQMCCSDGEYHWMSALSAAKELVKNNNLYKVFAQVAIFD